MKDLVLGFIGAGNMNTAILSGVLRKQMFPPERIWLSNRHAEKLSAFSKLGICTTTDNRAVARNADILILGVKPQMFGDVLPELKDLVSEKCVISIAAGISASYLKAELPGAHIIPRHAQYSADAGSGGYRGGPRGGRRTGAISDGT